MATTELTALLERLPTSGDESALAEPMGNIKAAAHSAPTPVMRLFLMILPFMKYSDELYKFARIYMKI